ncbi:MAG: hypothetical protein H6Q59_417 [Firmicutes bacterium]|nr:hypothetical protein [Bacillota bacterium]
MITFPFEIDLIQDAHLDSLKVRLPELIVSSDGKHGIGYPIADIIENIIATKIEQWKEGDFQTVLGVTDSIKSACSGNKYIDTLMENNRYLYEIQYWVTNRSLNLEQHLGEAETTRDFSDVTHNLAKQIGFMITPTVSECAFNASELITNNIAKKTLQIIVGLPMLRMVIMPQILNTMQLANQWMTDPLNVNYILPRMIYYTIPKFFRERICASMNFAVIDRVHMKNELINIIMSGENIQRITQCFKEVFTPTEDKR